jgi:hypothetical protein
MERSGIRGGLGPTPRIPARRACIRVATAKALRNRQIELRRMADLSDLLCVFAPLQRKSMFDLSNGTTLQ